MCKFFYFNGTQQCQLLSVESSDWICGAIVSFQFNWPLEFGFDHRIGKFLTRLDFLAISEKDFLYIVATFNCWVWSNQKIPIHGFLISLRTRPFYLNWYFILSNQMSFKLQCTCSSLILNRHLNVLTSYVTPS